MKNCFVTKLKSTIDNDNLDYLGYTTIEVGLSGDGFPASLTFTEDGKIILLDGKFTATDSREKSFTANVELTNFNYNSITPDVEGQTTCKILIPKYTCKKLVNVMGYNGVIDVACFNYIDNTLPLFLQVRSQSSNNCSIKNLKESLLPRFTTFSTSACDFDSAIDISTLGYSGNLTNFNMYKCTSSNIIGSFDNLGKSALSSIIIFPSTKTVSIDLKNFVDNNRNAGRTTGTINCRHIGDCVVKMNGEVINAPKGQWDNVLSWDATTITFRGETITA